MLEFGLVGQTMHQVDERTPVADLASSPRCTARSSTGISAERPSPPSTAVVCPRSISRHLMGLDAAQAREPHRVVGAARSESSGRSIGASPAPPSGAWRRWPCGHWRRRSCSGGIHLLAPGRASNGLPSFRGTRRPDALSSFPSSKTCSSGVGWLLFGRLGFSAQSSRSLGGGGWLGRGLRGGGCLRKFRVGLDRRGGTAPPAQSCRPWPSDRGWGQA